MYKYVKVITLYIWKNVHRIIGSFQLLQRRDSLVEVFLMHITEYKNHRSNHQKTLHHGGFYSSFTLLVILRVSPGRKGGYMGDIVPISQAEDMEATLSANSRAARRWRLGRGAEGRVLPFPKSKTETDDTSDPPDAA